MTITPKHSSALIVHDEILLLRFQVTASWPTARLVPRVQHWAITQQAGCRRRRGVSSSAAVQQSDQAASEQANTSVSSNIDWDAFDAHQKEVSRLSHAEEARLLLDSGRYKSFQTRCKQAMSRCMRIFYKMLKVVF